MRSHGSSPLLVINIYMKGKKQLKTIKEVMEYNPIAVFTPGNKVYDFFPGVKVQVFMGSR